MMMRVDDKPVNGLGYLPVFCPISLKLWAAALKVMTVTMDVTEDKTAPKEVSEMSTTIPSATRLVEKHVMVCPHDSPQVSPTPLTDTLIMFPLFSIFFHFPHIFHTHGKNMRGMLRYALFQDIPTLSHRTCFLGAGWRS